RVGARYFRGGLQNSMITSWRTDMNEDVSVKREKGFSLVEMLVSTAVFLPLVGAAVLLFGAGVDYYNAEQRAAQMNQEGRNAVESTSLAAAQARTRRDISPSNA